MPSARSARSAAARTAPRPAPRRPAAKRPHSVPLRSPVLRVRWERVGRFALLVTFAIVIALYAEHTISYVKTHGQAARQQAIVQQLRHENAGLRRSLSSLNDPRTIVHDARALGMVRPGEQAYAVTGSASP